MTKDTCEKTEENGWYDLDKAIENAKNNSAKSHLIGLYVAPTVNEYFPGRDLLYTVRMGRWSELTRPGSIVRLLDALSNAPRSECFITGYPIEEGKVHLHDSQGECAYHFHTCGDYEAMRDDLKKVLEGRNLLEEIIDGGKQ